MTKDSFIFELIFFILKKNFEHTKYFENFQIVKYWFSKWSNFFFHFQIVKFNLFLIFRIVTFLKLDEG